MLSEGKKSLMLYRLETAGKSLDAAKVLIDAQAFKDAANRSYYCVFHAMRAVLAKDGFDSKKHSGVIAAFRQRYLKTGIFSPVLSEIIRNAFDVRGKSDYEDFFVISKEDIVKQVEDAGVFLSAIENYINNILFKAIIR